MSTGTYAMPDPEPERLMLRSGGRIVLFTLEEIDFIEAAANYVRIHAGAREYVVRETMNTMEKKLAAGRFMRVHRSVIVNVSRVRRVHCSNGSEYSLILRDGKELPVGRSRLPHLDAALRSVGAEFPSPDTAEPAQS